MSPARGLICWPGSLMSGVPCVEARETPWQQGEAAGAGCGVRASAMIAFVFAFDFQLMVGTLAALVVLCVLIGVIRRLRRRRE